MQTGNNSNKIKIELITLNRLREYSRGKTEEVLENFTLLLGEGDEVNEIGEDNSVSKSQKPVSLDQKIKDFFSFLGPKKEKKSFEAMEEIKETKEPIIIKEENIKAAPGAGTKDSYEGRILAPAKKSGKKMIILIAVLFFLIGGIVLLVFSDEDLGNVKGVISKAKLVFSGNSNEVSTVIEEEEEEEEEIEEEPVSSVQETPVDYAALKTQELLGEGEIMEINLFSKDLPQQKESFVKKIMGIFGSGEQEEEGAITRAGIFNYLEQNLGLLGKNQIYFLNVYEGKRLLTFQELVDVLGLKMMPGLGEKMVTHKFLVYLEEKDNRVASNIRMGLLLIFEEGAISLENLKQWEPTLVGDLRNLYFDSNLELLEKGGNTFSDSTISERRRYINFSSNQLLSIDYAVAQDGVIIVSSKKFGTAILRLLLENNSVKKESTRSLEN